MSLSSLPEVVPIYVPFAQRMTNELSLVSIDHNYAKPWSTHPEASNARAARLLFMDSLHQQPNVDKIQDESEMIDVDGQEKPAMPEYDVSNARSMMSECERHAALLRPDFAEMKDDWEEHIASIRTTWSVLQNRLFAKVMRVLQGDCLARLTIKESKNEPIQRRLQIDKAAKRVRFAFANANWDMPLILWLHNLFLENLRGQLLTSYLEILQTLKLKTPSLIECLIEGTVCKPGSLTMDSLNILLKRTWDPVLSSINHQKPKKLPGQSLLLIISNAPFMANSPLAIKRHKFWQHQLNFMGKVFNIVPVNNSTIISVANCVENMVASTRSKILEVKGHFPGRPIILVGFHIGSLIACQVALMEQVHAVVCLGYPTMGVCGNRTEIDDPVYNYKTPTLFVVGQHASSCCVDDLEDIREKLRVDTGLVVVGGADDHLRICRARKKRCGVTQSVVDRCIIDEMTNFLGNSLQSELNSSDYMDDVEIGKKSPRKRKQKQAVAVGSQTPGDLVKQKSAKALKCLKQDPMLSSVGASLDSSAVAGVCSPTLQAMPKLTKTGKRGSPKKLLKSLNSESAVKKPFMQMNLKTGSLKKSQGQSSLTSRNEAAVIASAPELSNLLQNMKTDLSRFSTCQLSSSSPSSPSSSTPPQTNVSSAPSSFVPSPIQTTTAFTLSKFLLSPDIFKSGEKLPDSPDLSLDAKSDTSDAKPVMATLATLPAGDSTPKKRETQILIHTKDSSIPVTFPVTFTMASKILKSTAPLVRSASGGQAIPTIAFDNKPKLLQARGASVLQSLPTTPSILSSNLQSSIPSSKLVTTTSLMKGSIPAFKSPASSVINMGSDTVQMKETPPSTSSPGTVSIDLGQLSTSNNIVMKFGNPSKISLMPTLKTVSSSSLLSPDKRDVTVASLLRDVKNSVSINMPPTTVVKSQGASVSVPVYTSGNTSEKNLTILSSSDLLSSLSSSAGLITLKLSTPGSASTSAKVSNKTEGNEGIIKALSTPKNVTAMTFNPSNTGAGIGAKLAKPLLSQYLLKGPREEKAEHKGMPASVPVIFATVSKPNTTSTSGQLILQSTSSNKVSSPKPIPIHDKVETLGKVSSLLESSPITVGKPKMISTTTEGYFSKQVSTADTPPYKPTGKIQTLSSPSPSHIQARTLSTPPSTPTPTPRATKSTIASYTPVSKQNLPTAASTRTRRIKTPKQYDL